MGIKLNNNLSYKGMLKPLKEHNFDIEDIPLVSVSCITYNHVKFIEKTIEGFLMQIINFPVEILIHDDASTDGTSEIILKFQKRYPRIIKPIIQNTNQYSQGVRGISRTFNIPRAQGKYIAFCEGDDYWTDPSKLQKQVDFLQRNPDYSLCSHEVYYTRFKDSSNIRKVSAIFYQNFRLSGFKTILPLIQLFLFNRNEFWKRRRKPHSIKRFNIADFKIALETAMNRRYIPTMSIVLNKDIILSIPVELYKFSAGHKLVILWSSLHGKMRHLNDVMGVKNTQENSITVTKVHIKNLKESDFISRDIEVLKILEEYAYGEFKLSIKNKIAQLIYQN